MVWSKLKLSGPSSLNLFGCNRSFVELIEATFDVVLEEMHDCLDRESLATIVKEVAYEEASYAIPGVICALLCHQVFPIFCADSSNISFLCKRYEYVVQIWNTV